ncbi:MAG: hypothetical protein S4CHLAM6_01360 [Chlamydiae bacterium]|nr:hypothetical protein [Chlamydiota bacterium]
MNKTIVITQSAYIPWRGYFDLINLADEFIIYDDTQFSTTKAWRNRNQIKTKNGPEWLTIPIKTKGKFLQKIDSVEINSTNWAKKHWKTIKLIYSKADYFDLYAPIFEDLYQACSKLDSLSSVNCLMIKNICKLLDISTPISFSKDYGFENLKKTDRLIEICKKSNATHYLSGPSAKSYLENKKFLEAGVQLLFMDNSGYPAYPQRFEEFIPNVSILDLLFNVGPNSKTYMKSYENKNLHLSLNIET